MPKFINQEQFNTWLKEEYQLIQDISTNNKRTIHYKYDPCDRFIGMMCCITGSVTCCAPCTVWDILCCTLDKICNNPFKWGCCFDTLSHNYDFIFMDKYRGLRREILESSNIGDYIGQITPLIDEINKFKSNELISMEYLPLRTSYEILKLGELLKTPVTQNMN